MIKARFPFPFFIILLLQFTAFASSSNLTLILQVLSLSLTHTHTPLFHSPISEFAYSLSRFVETKDVLRAVSAKQKWDSNDVRVANLDVAKVRFGTSRSYEFRIGFGTGNFTLKFADKVATWNKFRTPFPDLPSLVHRLGSFPFLPTLKLEGPFSLRVDALHHLSLSLPVSNFFSSFSVQISVCYVLKFSSFIWNL